MLFQQLNMYRVLLKIDKVTMRIKEAVSMHIIIKKKQEFFTHCKHQTLVSGVLVLDNSSEFLITRKDPSFQIDLYLIIGTMKKKGGSVIINLSHYTQNASHRISAPIQNTPLQNSALLVDFTYMGTQDAFSTRSLVSLAQLEEIRHKEYLGQLTQQNQELVMENERLGKELVELMEKNEVLQGESQQMELESEKREESFKVEMAKMEQEKSHNYETLLKEKKKIAEIMDIINETENAHLINEMGQIISKKEETQYAMK